MAYRGRGRGRGGFGGRGRGPAKQVAFELYPELEDLGTAQYSTKHVQLIKWYSNLQKYWNSSPYYYEGGSERSKNVQTLDVERLSDKDVRVANAKPPLWHFIKLDIDHVPAELARGDKKEKLGSKRVKWNPESAGGVNKLDLFEKLEEKHEGQEGKERKENEDQEDDNEGNEEEADEEFSDEGDYEQNEYFDDDEDDYNMANDNDDEPFF